MSAQRMGDGEDGGRHLRSGATASCSDPLQKPGLEKLVSQPLS